MTTNGNQNPLEALQTDASFARDVAQVRAKAILTELTGGAPPYRWSYTPTRLSRHSSAALWDLGSVSLSNLDRISEFEPVARQIAQAWEAFAKLGEGATRHTALLNAAAAYEYAGYQANAACLSKLVIGEGPSETETDFQQLVALFMQRQFIRVISRAAFWSREPPTARSLDGSMWSAASLALGASGLALAARYFLSGSTDSQEESQETISLAERGFAEIGSVSEANLLRIIRSLLPVMTLRSTWTILGHLVPNNPRWSRYLKLLARGTGEDVFRNASISELWPSQIDAIRQDLFDQSSTKAVRMPTSAGKTRVAELAMVHTLVSEPNVKCVYVAPYRALVGEVEQTFLNLFADLGYSVSSVVGTYESDDFEQLLVSDADVLVVTPEKLDLLLRLQSSFLERVRLIILDEAQLVNDIGRGVKYDLLLTRLKRRLANARFLLLSAVVSEQTLVDFLAWLSVPTNPGSLITSDWRPSVQRYAKFEWAGDSGVLRYSSLEDVQLLQEFVPGIIASRMFEFTNPATRRINRQKFPDTTNKSQISAELAFKLSTLGPVLVFCPQPNFAEAVGKALNRRLELQRLVNLPVPAAFQTPSTRSAHAAKQWLGEEHLVTKLLSQGVAIHHGNLPDVVRRAVETDFRERRYPVMLATNTLAQGVNLPIRTVIIHSCWRHVGDRMQRVPAKDYWNIAGRAGRAREETEGTIIHVTVTS